MNVFKLNDVTLAKLTINYVWALIYEGKSYMTFLKDPSDEQLAECVMSAWNSEEPSLLSPNTMTTSATYTIVRTPVVVRESESW